MVEETEVLMLKPTARLTADFEADNVPLYVLERDWVNVFESVPGPVPEAMVF
ncbi:hypothetical protein [Glutamicibacter ardleyensis]|uniref:hypothetical protein n=1 Tax=Glutamicibacter ardleyensis TaxID=225894 RepID=UPI003FD1AD2E